MIRRLLLLAAVALLPRFARAHPLNPALLELRERGDGLVDVTWRAPSTTQVMGPFEPVLPDGCSTASVPTLSRSQAAQSIVQRWQARCPGGLVAAHLRVVGLRERRTEALVRVQLADGRSLQGVLRDDDASYTVPERPGWRGVFRAYAAMGVLHILSGPDHLLFVLGLVLLVRDRRRLLWTVTAFTMGHSVTLSVAALGLVRIPAAPVEVLIAVTLLVVAVELTRNAVRETWSRRAPWAMAFTFGLLHGLGFASALARVGLPQGEIPLALFSFNVGIETGQLAFVLVVCLARAALRRGSPRLETTVARLVPAVIGSLAWFWILDRTW